MKKQKPMSWMKGQVTIPEKQLNEVEIGNLAEKQTNKQNQNKDSENDSGSWENNQGEN